MPSAMTGCYSKYLLLPMFFRCCEGQAERDEGPGEGGGGITPTHSAYSEVKSSFMW